MPLAVNHEFNPIMQILGKVTRSIISRCDFLDLIEKHRKSVTSVRREACRVRVGQAQCMNVERECSLIRSCSPFYITPPRGRTWEAKSRNRQPVICHSLGPLGMYLFHDSIQDLYVHAHAQPYFLNLAIDPGSAHLHKSERQRDSCFHWIPRNTGNWTYK